jgi:hypothetical protein
VPRHYARKSTKRICNEEQLLAAISAEKSGQTIQEGGEEDEEEEKKEEPTKLQRLQSGSACNPASRTLLGSVVKKDLIKAKNKN